MGSRTLEETNSSSANQNGSLSNGLSNGSSGHSSYANGGGLHPLLMDTNKVSVVLGAQWGDEGKGKLVDLLASDADIVCRCQVCCANVRMRMTISGQFSV
jgi:hypothetical protein